MKHEYHEGRMSNDTKHEYHEGRMSNDTKPEYLTNFEEKVRTSSSYPPPIEPTKQDVPVWSDWGDEEWVRAAMEAYGISEPFCFFSGARGLYLVMPRDMSFELGSGVGRNHAQKSARQHTLVQTYESRLRSEWEMREKGEPVLKHYAIIGPLSKEQIGCQFAFSQEAAEAEIHVKEPRAILVEIDELTCKVCHDPSESEASEAKPEPTLAESMKQDVCNGFLCGAWKTVRESDGIYVMRCDRPQGHKQDHVDSMLLTNWKGPTPKAVSPSPAPRKEVELQPLPDMIRILPEPSYYVAALSQREKELRYAFQSIDGLGQALYAKIEECKRLKQALTLALPVMEEDQEVAERSFLPEPSKEEEEILTRYTEAIDAARKILSEAKEMA